MNQLYLHRMFNSLHGNDEDGDGERAQVSENPGSGPPDDHTSASNSADGAESRSSWPFSWSSISKKLGNFVGWFRKNEDPPGSSMAAEEMLQLIKVWMWMQVQKEVVAFASVAAELTRQQNLRRSVRDGDNNNEQTLRVILMTFAEVRSKLQGPPTFSSAAELLEKLEEAHRYIKEQLALLTDVVDGDVDGKCEEVKVEAGPQPQPLRNMRTCVFFSGCWA